MAGGTAEHTSAPEHRISGLSKWQSGSPKQLDLEAEEVPVDWLVKFLFNRQKGSQGFAAGAPPGRKIIHLGQTRRFEMYVLHGKGFPRLIAATNLCSCSHGMVKNEQVTEAGKKLNSTQYRNRIGNCVETSNLSLLFPLIYTHLRFTVLILVHSLTND